MQNFTGKFYIFLYFTSVPWKTHLVTYPPRRPNCNILKVCITLWPFQAWLMVWSGRSSDSALRSVRMSRIERVPRIVTTTAPRPRSTATKKGVSPTSEWKVACTTSASRCCSTWINTNSDMGGPFDSVRETYIKTGIPDLCEGSDVAGAAVVLPGRGVVGGAARWAAGCPCQSRHRPANPHPAVVEQEHWPSCSTAHSYSLPLV